MKKLILAVLVIASIFVGWSYANAVSNTVYPPLFPGVIDGPAEGPLTFPEVPEPFATDTSPFPCWLVSFPQTPCAYPEYLLDMNNSHEDKMAFVTNVLIGINPRYVGLTDVQFPGESAPTTTTSIHDYYPSNHDSSSINTIWFFIGAALGMATIAFIVAIKK